MYYLGIEELLAVEVGRALYAWIFAAETFLQALDIALRLILRHWEIMEKAVATGGRGSARNDFVVVNDVLEGEEHQVANLLARVLSLYDEVVAGEAAHRSPIDDTILPLLIIAKEGCHEMLYRMNGRRSEGWLLIRCRHTNIVCGDVLSRYFIGAGNVDSWLKICMVNSKTWD